MKSGNMYSSRLYKFNSTKEYVEAFPVAYRQWRDNEKIGSIPGCNKLHGYAFSFKFYFGSDDLDFRNWVMDYGSLKGLKAELQEQFDHVTLVAEDDPEIEWYREAQRRKVLKLNILPALGCEMIADQLYRFVNGVYIPNEFGTGESERLWCYRVEVRETQSNMAFREGHREWNEDLFA